VWDDGCLHLPCHARVTGSRQVMKRTRGRGGTGGTATIAAHTCGEPSDTAVIRRFTSPSSIFTAAVADGVVKRNPVTGVRLPRQDGQMRVPLTAEQVDAIAEHIDSRLELAVRLAATTGLRQGELFGLTRDRVRWLKRELVVDRQLVTPAKGEPSLGPVKTARSVRTVPLPDHLLERLSSGGQRDGDVFVFLRDGKPWSRNRAADAFKRAADAAGVEASGWHALRHYTASVLIREGLSVTAVAGTLGHSPAECLKTYAGWWPSEHELVRSAMTRALA
jgi:integrase